MLSFLERMQDVNMPETDDWYRGQAEHFRQRLIVMLECAPKDCKPMVADFQKRLEKLRIFK